MKISCLYNDVDNGFLIRLIRGVIQEAKLNLVNESFLTRDEHGQLHYALPADVLLKIYKVWLGSGEKWKCRQL